jgi:Tfp pilus assembly protein PilX
MKTSPFPSRRVSPVRGSVLIVAMILVAVIGISLASYLSLNMNSTRLSQRSYMATAAMNLADTGVEEAVWSINQAVGGGTGAWTDWASVGTTDRRRNFSGFTLGAGLTGNVRVFVENANLTAAPRVAARATITPSSGVPGGGHASRPFAVCQRSRC